MSSITVRLVWGLAGAVAIAALGTSVRAIDSGPPVPQAVEAHLPPTPTTQPGEPVHPTLQMSIAIDSNGDNIDDCDTAGGPTTCQVPVGAAFRVKTYLNNLSDVSGYTGVNLMLLHSGANGTTGTLDAMNDANCLPWPEHSSLTPNYNGGITTWSCAVAPWGSPSNYVGLVGSFGFTCPIAPSTGNQIDMHHGNPYNDPPQLGSAINAVLGADGQLHGEDGTFANEMLSVDCINAPSNDSDGDGLANAFEAGFGSGGISITNLAGATASATGAAPAGSIITSGSLSIYLPGGTTASDGTNPVSVLFAPGPLPAVMIQNANLGGGRKAVEMPMGGGSAVCINDQAAATISSVDSNQCLAPAVLISVPPTGSVSQSATTPDNTPTTYTVTRVGPAVVNVDGLVHSAVALQSSSPSVGGVALQPDVTALPSAAEPAGHDYAGYIYGAVIASVVAIAGAVGWRMRRA